MILVSKNHKLLRSVDARSGGCCRRSCGRKLGASQFLSPRITRSCILLMLAPAAAAAAPAAEPRSGGCGLCWERTGPSSPNLNLASLHAAGPAQATLAGQSCTRQCVSLNEHELQQTRQRNSETPISKNMTFDIESKKLRHRTLISKQL